MNKQFIITNFAAFALMLFLPTGCRQADGKQDAVQSYRVIKVAASPVEISESYSAAIRGRQDVDILPQISGRIIRLKVKEGERVKTGQVLAVIDQVPYRAALRTAQANVSAAQAKVETARIELRGKQALFDEKVISDYELSLARNQLAVACAELEQAKAQESDARNNLSYTEIKSPSNGVVGTLPYRIGALVGPNMAQPFTDQSPVPQSRPRTVEWQHRQCHPSKPENGGRNHSHDRHRGTAGQDYRLPSEKRTGGSRLSHGGPPERRQPVYRKRRSFGR